MYNSNVKKTYYFRNKDIDCFSFIYDAENNKIISFKKLEGFNFIIPYLKTDNLEILKEYLLFDRPIPYSRKNFNVLFLKDYDIFKLYNTNFGLNLDDTFWIVSEDKKDLKWNKVNFYKNFHNDFSLEMLSDDKPLNLNNTTEIFLPSSPDLFPNGELKKTWKKVNKKIYLYKSSSISNQNIQYYEPFAEYLASQVAALLFNDYVKYDLILENNLILNTCKIFTSENVSYLPFSYAFMPNDYLDKNILEEKIKDAYGEEQFEDLMLFDALILNIDRHLGNFGLLVSSNTQEKIKNAPIFDNGKSLIFDFKTYQGKVGKMHLNNYSSRPSKMCQSLDYQLEKFLFKRHISWIQKLEKFEFKNSSNVTIDKNYFKFIKKLFKQRIILLKKIYQKKFGVD